MKSTRFLQAAGLTLGPRLPYARSHAPVVYTEAWTEAWAEVWQSCTPVTASRLSTGRLLGDFHLHCAMYTAWRKEHSVLLAALPALLEARAPSHSTNELWR